MNYKKFLGIEPGEDIDKDSVFSFAIDDFFLKMGFYLCDRRPRFFVENEMCEKVAASKTLRFDTLIDRTIFRIFMNKAGLYIEKERHSGFEGNVSKEFESPITLEEIESKLNDALYEAERVHGR